MAREPLFTVYDPEEAYTLKLVEYARTRKNMPMQVNGFSDAAALLDYTEKHAVNVLLIRPDKETDLLRKVKAEKILLLEDGAEGENTAGYPGVHKYQAAGSLLKEVMDCYSAERLSERPGEYARRNCGIYAVYSPAGGCRKTSFALTLSRILARDRAVLYLNLENHSALEEIIGCRFEKSLSDFLYFLRLDKPGLVSRLSSFTLSFQNLDIAPPPDNYADVCAARGEEWLKFIDALKKETAYEAVVLDLGDGVCDLYDVLDTAVRIFVPLRDDPVCEAKYRAFLAAIGRWGNPSLAERLEPLQLPFLAVTKTGSEYFESLVWSRMGDTVKDLLRKKEKQP